MEDRHSSLNSEHERHTDQRAVHQDCRFDLFIALAEMSWDTLKVFR